MAAAPNIVVRKATEEDYQPVLDITKEFNMGADYLNVQYSELINDPDSSYYVCVVDGEVVAFEGVSLVDDNDTLMTRSARVKEKFRGQGLLTAIRKKIYDDYKDVPGQKRVRTCCTNAVRLVNSPTFRSQNRVLGIRPSVPEEMTADLNFVVRALSLYQPMEKIQIPSSYENLHSKVRELDPQDLSLIFQHPQLVNYLFPSGFISTISWFFSPQTSNIKHIQKQHPYIIVSPELDQNIQRLNSLTISERSQHSSRTSNDKDTDVLPSGMLALIAHYKAPAMILLTIDMYGELRQGQETIDLSNVIFHSLQFAISVMEQDKLKHPLALGLAASSNDVLDLSKQIVAPLGFCHGEFDVIKSHYFFEQDFEKLSS